MNFYWIIPFLAIVLLATSNGAILSSEKKDKIKYSLLVFNTCLLVWACLDMILWVNRFDGEAGLVLEKLMSIFWLTICFLFLNFVFQLLQKKRNTAYFIFLFVSLGFVIISLTTDKIILGVEKVYWGIFPVFGSWILIAVGFVIATAIYAISLILNAKKKETNITRKKIYGNLVLGLIITIVIDSTFDVVLPVIFETKIISLTTLGNSFLAVFLLQIINKHHFLELSTEEISETIFNKVSDGIILTDENGTLLMLNNAAKSLLENKQQEIDKIINLSKSNESQIKTKVINLSNGESKYLNISKNAITDTKSKRILNLYVLNDVSTLVKFKNSLLDKNDELQITLYRIAHDIKGPSSATKQLIEFCKTDRKNIDLYLEKIEISTNQLINFIKEVETIIRIKEVVPVYELIDLKQILNRCWEELEFYRQNNKHKLDVFISAESFRSDPNLIYAILLNIISNAIKYNDIEHKGENIIEINSVLSENHIEITISDNGLGMNETTINNVFKLFYRGKTQVGGAGLGMYIVKSSIEKLQGSIDVFSEDGKGSSFKIKIPVNFSYLNN